MEKLRKLATIRKITDIRPIEGADKIEIATVGGWNVVVAKDVEHKVGNSVVYCEIDSFLPIKEEFEFLRKSSYKKMGDQEGFRLKTIRLRGQLSQGLILPISVVPITQFATGHDLPEGLDVTEMLGIVKYEPPIPAELSGKVKGGFPSFLRKTDEERVQNLVKEYEEYKLTSEHQFYMTEKLDGSSATFYMNESEFGVCSRNLELLETEGNTFWKVARELDLENKFKIKGNICLQGELIVKVSKVTHTKSKDRQFISLTGLILIHKQE
jgi:RNA ligase (TIGR02306 family)